MFKKFGLLAAGLIVVLVSTGACNGKSSDLSYTAPFEIGVAAGNFLPGTELQYLGMSGDTAEMLINGQRALKKKADSLSWEGEVRQGVSLDLDLRVLWFDEDSLHVGQSASVTIQDPQAHAATPPENAALKFSNAPVAYTVKKDEAIPGTLLTFKGKTDEGVELGGTDDYPYRKAGDSIVWMGTIQGNVWLELDLRVGLYTDKTMTVAGLATIWVEP